MKSPFYRVYLDPIAQIEITDNVEGFRYEDCIGKDNLIELKAFDNNALELLNNKALIKGKIVLAHFGYIGGAISPVHRCRITDIDTKYADRVTLTIKALDLGTTMKKSTSLKIWKGKKSSDIAEEIAKKYGLEIVVDKTTKVWDNLPQGHRTDFEFLAYLATKEKDGNYVFFVRNEKLNFVRKGLDKKALFTYTYGEKDTELIEFYAKERESTEDAGAINTNLAHMDPKTKTVTGTSANNANEKNALDLAEYKHVYDENGNEVSVQNVKTGQFMAAIPAVADKVYKKVSDIGRTLVHPASSSAEATDMANHHHKGKKELVNEAVWEMRGNPLIYIDELLTMKGVHKRHEGNWYVHKATHNIDSGGYKTTCETQRGANRSIGVKSSNVNKTVGKKEKDDNTIIAHVYSEDGIEVAERTKSDKFVAPQDHGLTK